MVHPDPKELNLYKPGRLFPPISITGDKCNLSCKHCMGLCLKHMIPAPTPEVLREILVKIKRRGGYGALISGGADETGEVQLSRFLPVINWAKKTLGLTFNIHTGLPSYKTIKEIARYKPGTVSIDVIGSDETIREVIGLKRTVKDYARALSALSNVGIKVTPHIIVGLHYGHIKGEFKALRIAKLANPSKLVIISLIPLPHTPFENIEPPSAQMVSRVIKEASKVHSNLELILGCMRPFKLRDEIDKAAIDAGINGIAIPSTAAIEYAKFKGYSLRWQRHCCGVERVELYP
ncbi:MAG TPA: radical SAM protein [Candidatus Bathyarchaeota archaeon]|nr:radical SAM protein [Candidatus Bathyarchaeota archaeon]